MDIQAANQMIIAAACILAIVGNVAFLVIVWRYLRSRNH